jgi:tRNA/rRNA methyltransferase
MSTVLKPTIILIKPQLAENIGTAARAMHNCGLEDLRLVAPKHGWPNDGAIKPAAGGACVVEKARVFATTAEAIADLNKVYATTARTRDQIKYVYTPKGAAADFVAEIASGNKIGVLFGPERTGLDNEDLVLSNASINVPLNPEYTSLNLAQAVLLIGYEWFQANSQMPMPMQDFRSGDTDVATKGEMQDLFAHLEQELDNKGFLRVKHKRPVMVRNIRNMFSRMPLTSQEVRTLRGIIASLVKK